MTSMASRPSRLGLTLTIRKAIKERIIVSMMRMPRKLLLLNRIILRHHNQSIKVNSKEDFPQGLGLSELRQGQPEEQAIRSIKDTGSTPQLITLVHSRLTPNEMLC